METESRADQAHLPGVLWLAFLTIFLVSCTTTPRDTPTRFSAPTARVAATVTETAMLLEDPGTIVVEDGSACGESQQSGEEEIVELAGSFDLPGYADSATVVLNGWRVAYLGGDEHIRGVSAAIEDIELQDGVLSWRARGFLADKDFADGYEFCYHYAVIAWNGGEIDAVADHDDENDNFEASFFDGKNTTALTALSSYVESPVPGTKPSVAILPRGFNMAWANQSDAFPTACFDCPVDHHLLQLDYNMDHPEAYLPQGEDFDSLPTPTGTEDASRVDPARHSWESYFIMKDNSSRRDYWLGESFSALAGSDVDYFVPPFTILPKEDVGPFTGCIGGQPELTQEFEIRDIPFDYAIPLLTGWEIGYGCDDQHVKRMGIWLADVEYDKDPDASTGTLRYTLASVLKDDDNFPGHFARHKVTVLGLNASEPSDLVVQETAPNFCATDAEGRLLVTVANIGAGAAGPSAARVLFDSGDAVALATPAVPAGFSGTLDPVTIPPACGERCEFRIRADAQSQVSESNEQNNVAGGTCIVPL